MILFNNNFSIKLKSEKRFCYRNSKINREFLETNINLAECQLYNIDIKLRIFVYFDQKGFMKSLFLNFFVKFSQCGLKKEKR